MLEYVLLITIIYSRERVKRENVKINGLSGNTTNMKARSKGLHQGMVSMKFNDITLSLNTYFQIIKDNQDKNIIAIIIVMIAAKIS